jgi:hypothetical protein
LAEERGVVVEEEGEAGFLSIHFSENNLGEARVAEQRPPDRFLGRDHFVLEFLVNREIADEPQDEWNIRFRGTANVEPGHSVG